MVKLFETRENGEKDVEEIEKQISKFETENKKVCHTVSITASGKRIIAACVFSEPLTAMVGEPLKVECNCGKRDIKGPTKFRLDRGTK